MAEKIIIDVQVNSDDAKKRAALLVAELDRMNAELAANARALRRSGGSNLEAAAAVARLKREIDAANSELRREQKEVVAVDNSMDALAVTIAKLHAQQKKINTSTPEGAEEFEKLTAQLNEARNKFNDLSKASGNPKSNIGRYTEAIREALGSNSAFANSLGVLEGALGQLGGATKLLSSSLLAIPFVAIISAITIFLTKTKAGRDLMERFGTMAQAVFGRVVELIEAGVKSLSKFIENFDLKTVLKNAGESVLEFIKTRLSALYSILEGVGQLMQSVFEMDFDKARAAASKLSKALTDLNPVGGLVKEITEEGKKLAAELAKAAKEGDRIAQSNIRARDSIRALNKEAGKAQKLAEEARKQRDDTTKTEAQRLALNKEAEKQELARIDALKEVNRLQQQIINNEIAISGGQANATDAQKDALAQLQIDRLLLDEEYAEKTTETLTEGNNIRREELTALANFEAELLRTRVLQNEIAGEELLNAEIAIIEKRMEAALSGLNEESQEYLFIKQQFYNQQLELRRKFEEDNAEITDEFADKNAKDAKKDANKLVKIEAKALDEKKEIANAEEQLQLAKLDAARQISGLIADIAGENSVIAKAAFLFDKALAIAEIIINGQIASSVIAETYAAAPPVAAALIAKQQIQTGIQVATVAATSIAGFARGGYTGDGGTYEPAGTVHRGEFVVPKRAVQALGGASRVASMVGVPVGGYANGGMVGSSIADRAINSRSMSNLSNDLRALQVQVSVTDIRKAEGRYDKIQTRVNA